MKTHNRILMLLLLAAAAWPVMVDGQTAPTRQPRPDFRERYSIVSEQNVFLRDRRRRRDERNDRPSQPPPRREEEFFALRGVVFEEGAFRAYMENLSTSTIVRLAVGDTVARGRISQIELDAVAYEQGGRHIWIEVGKNLTGAQATASAPASQPGGSSEGGAAPPLTGDPNDPSLSIEQRMKLRRQQQMGGK